MSAIDQYDHECLGVIVCQPDYHYFYPKNAFGEPTAEALEMTDDNVPELHIPVYRLLQDIDDPDGSISGKTGYILVGGGSGEIRGLSFNMVEILKLRSGHPDANEDIWTHEHIEEHWFGNKEFILITAFVNLGWHPAKDDEVNRFILDHIANYLLEHYPDEYSQYIGPDGLPARGSNGTSIVRPLTGEEDRFWNYRRYDGRYSQS